MKSSKSLSLAIIALILALAGPIGATLEVIAPKIGFALFFGGGALGLAALVWGLLAKRRGKTRGGALAAIVGLLPFMAVAVPGGLAASKGYPRINDVSTTGAADAPSFEKSPVHGAYEATVAEIVKKEYPEVKALATAASTEAAIKAATELARERGWTIEATATGFEGYEKSRLFKFRDDIVVRVTASGGGTVVDMRSASRDGQSDLGVNAARIERFLGDLAKRLK